ncbi:MAG: ABC transporter permease [Planctomycetes bacterium]|nr:ABC transporter permease [Planctomycetota bacterium]
MRWYILKTLLYKEALRHATNRGGLMLAALLVTASLVLSVMNPVGEKNSQFIGGVHHCLLNIQDFDGPWSKHLQENIPPELKNKVLFNKLDPSIKPNETIVYPTGAGGIQIRNLPTGDGKSQNLVWLWYPDGDRAGMAAYEQWFWRESYRFWHMQAAAKLNAAGIDAATKFPMPELKKDDLWDKRLILNQFQSRYAELSPPQTDPLPVLELKESPLVGSSLDMRAAIATALVMFALFFTCVYLMPSLTCEERERGLLIAQALSPARVREILAAKFLFYPTFGILLAMLLGGIHNPNVLIRPFFWLSLICLGMGSLGIGMTIASLAKTQRSASLAALCYMLVVALVLLVCQQHNIMWVPFLAIEYHAPQVLHATLTNQTRTSHWYNLLGCGILSIGWVLLAGFLFRKRGWQ